MASASSTAPVLSKRQHYATPSSISILLNQPDNFPDSNPEVVFSNISDEFSKKYLQALNITPTITNKQIVKKNLPVSSLGLQAQWGNRGVTQDAMKIMLNNLDNETGSKMKFKLENELPEIARAEPQRDTNQTHKPLVGFEEDTHGRLAYQFSKHDLLPGDVHAQITDEIEVLRQKRINRALMGVEAQAESVLRKHYLEVLAILKKKFIFPFCAEVHEDDNADRKGEKILSRTGDLRVVSMAADKEILDLQVPDHLVNNITEMFQVTLNELTRAIGEFVENDMPFEFLSRRRNRDISRLKKMLTSRGVIEIAGLTAHLFYWRCFGHLHFNPLSQASVDAVYCSVTDRWSTLEESVKSGPDGMFFLSSMVLTLKWALDWAFRKQYSSVIESIKTQFIYKLNVFFLRTFDRDTCVYSHFGALNGCAKAIKLKNILKLKPNAFKASNIVETLMCSGDCEDSSTRALLLKSRSTGAPSSEDIQDDSKCALYQIALRRLNRHKNP